MKEILRRGWIFGIIEILLYTFQACTYNKNETPAQPATCDTVQVSYSKTVVPILQQNCYSCHAGAQPSSAVSLDHYEDFKYYATLPGDLLMHMITQQGGRPMPQPPAAKLDDCSIKKIGAWIHAGAENN